MIFIKMFSLAADERMGTGISVVRGLSGGLVKGATDLHKDNNR